MLRLIMPLAHTSTQVLADGDTLFLLHYCCFPRPQTTPWRTRRQRRHSQYAPASTPTPQNELQTAPHHPADAPMSSAAPGTDCRRPQHSSITQPCAPPPPAYSHRRRRRLTILALTRWPAHPAAARQCRHSFPPQCDCVHTASPSRPPDPPSANQDKTTALPGADLVAVAPPPLRNCASRS